MKKIDTFYEPIGRMIVAFQDLESTLSLIFMSLVREDPNVTMSLVAGLSFSRRLDALCSLASFKMNAALASELADIVKAIGSYENRRNMIVHSSWIGTVDGKQVFRHKPGVSRKKGLVGGIRNASVSDVTDVTKDIQDAHARLLRLAKKLTDQRVITIKTFEEVETGAEQSVGGDSENRAEDGMASGAPQG